MWVYLFIINLACIFINCIGPANIKPMSAAVYHQLWRKVTFPAVLSMLQLKNHDFSSLFELITWSFLVVFCSDPWACLFN